MNEDTIKITLPDPSTISDKSQLLSIFLQEIYNKSPQNMQKAIILIDRAFHLDSEKIPVPDVLSNQMYYEVSSENGKMDSIDIYCDFDTANFLDIMLDDLQLSAQKTLETKGTDLVAAKQLSAISHVEMFIKSDGSFSMENVVYLTPEDIQNLDHYDDFDKSN